MQRKLLLIEDSRTSMNMMRNLIAHIDETKLLSIYNTRLVQVKHFFLVQPQSNTFMQF